MGGKVARSVTRIWVQMTPAIVVPAGDGSDCDLTDLVPDKEAVKDKTCGALNAGCQFN